MAELYVSGPQADFSPGLDSYQSCEDWAKEVKLLLKDPPLTKGRQYRQTMLCLWQAKQGTHIKSLRLIEAQRADPDTLLKKFKDWTNPSPMSFKQQQPSYVWIRGTPPLLSSLTRPLSCVTSATILEKPRNDYP